MTKAKRKPNDSLFAKSINEENRSPAYQKGLKIYKVPLSATDNPKLITSPDLISKAIGEVISYD